MSSSESQSPSQLPNNSRNAALISLCTNSVVVPSLYESEFPKPPMLVKLPGPHPYAHKQALVLKVVIHVPWSGKCAMFEAPKNEAKLRQPLAANASPSRAPK